MISVIKLLQTNCVQCANLQMNKYLKKLDYVYVLHVPFMTMNLSRSGIWFLQLV